MVYIFEIIVASYIVLMILAGFLGDLPDIKE